MKSLKSIKEYLNLNNLIIKTKEYHTQFSNLLKDPFYRDLWQGGISFQNKLYKKISISKYRLC